MSLIYSERLLRALENSTFPMDVRDQDGSLAYRASLQTARRLVAERKVYGYGGRRVKFLKFRTQSTVGPNNASRTTIGPNWYTRSHRWTDPETSAVRARHPYTPIHGKQALLVGGTIDVPSDGSTP